MTRDITKAQFEKELRKRGWKPGLAMLGYWESECGLSVSALNWSTRRAALAGMLKTEAKYIAQQEASAKPAAQEEPKP